MLPVVPHAVLGLLLYTAGGGADDTFIGYSSYCLTYFGSVEVSVELPDAVPDYNYNGSTLCPPFWDFDRVQGATLQVCPPNHHPSDGPNYRALGVTLHFEKQADGGPSGIGLLRLDDVLITNGSVKGPFPNRFNDHSEPNPDAKPAILAPDDAKFETLDPVFTINGTQAALDDDSWLDLSCHDFDDPDSYCGYYEDEGDCWGKQRFEMDSTPRTRLNFTVRFDDVEAWVDMWTEDEYLQGSNGTRTGSGSYTAAHVKFWGNTRLPSITDYDFWENYYGGGYEGVRDDLVNADIELHADEARMPVLFNRTGNGEKYFAGNGTYSSTSLAAADGVGLGFLGVMMLAGSIFLPGW